MHSRRFLRPMAPLVCVLASLLITPLGRTQQPRRQLKGHVPPAVLQGKAPRLGAMAASEPMRLAIQLPLRNQAELRALIQQLYDPASPNYHRYLSAEDFTARFGPTAADYQAVVDFATASGLVLGGAAKNRLLVNITGTAAQVEGAFGVKMGIYQHPSEDRTFYSPDREPSLNLSVPVAHIIGLNSFSGVRKGWKNRDAGGGGSGDAFSATGSGPNGSFLVGDLRAAYYGGTALTGSGQCVGMYELGGYDPSDVTNSLDGVPYSVPVNNVLIDGAAAGVTPGGDDIEQVMDIVAAIGMAPGMSQVRVYIGPADAWGDVNIINSMATENQCQQLSSSYSWSNPDYVQDNGVFEEFAAQGQTFLNCTLDDGSYGTSFPWTYPQDDIWVTAVGGTDLITSGPGGAWVSESAWAESGGGLSMNGIGIPSWQLPAINPSNGGSTSIRNVPDISAEANTDNYLCYTSSGSQTCADGWGGTSIATPRWAGFLALANQQSVAQGKSTVGYLNPTLYNIGLSANYDTIFHDITSGNNDCCSQSLFYNAVPGYDLATGWGSPNGQNMINALVGGSYTSAVFMIQNSQDNLPLPPGSVYSTTLSVFSVYGFTGTVELGVTGLPSGVTATLSPTSVTLSAQGTATSTVTWTISSSAPLGAANISLTATSGPTTETEPVALTVAPPTTLQFSVATLDFGTAPVGSGSSGAVVYLDNTGTTIALFPPSNSATTSNSAFAVTQDNCAPVLLPGKTCQIYLSFTPPVDGPATGTLTITDNGSGSPQTVSLTGAGGAGSVSLSTPGLQFGDFPAGIWGNFYEVDVLNTTPDPVTFPSPIGTTGPFLENDDCMPSVGPRSACWITMEFQPVTLGPATGTVTVFNSGTDSPLTATLSGFGGTQTVMLYPPANAVRTYPPVGGVKFGYQTENETSVPQLVTLFNGTSNTLALSQISTSGSFGQTNNCGSTLAVYASCIIQVTFTPATTGATTGALTVTDSDSTSPQTLALGGTGIVASDGTLTLSPSSYDFGSVPTNNWSNVQVFNLINNGSSPVNIESVSLVGPFYLALSYSGTVAPGASCDVQVESLTGVVGKVNGEIMITDSDGNHYVPLSITGVPQTVTLSPAGLTFGNQAVDTTSASRTVTLLNNLPNTLVITGVNASGPFAPTSNCGNSLKSWGASCTINVTFTPTAPGAATGTLTVTDTASNSPQTITLTGTGAPALAITASSASMTYGEAVPTITPSYVGFVSGDTADHLTTPPTCTTTATPSSPVGSYPSTCSGAVDPNYTISYTGGTVTVGAAPLTITASSGTMTYGGTPPSVTPGYSAFGNGQNASSLATPPTCTTTANSSTPVGTATGANTCTGAVDPNYTFIYVAGNMTVGKAALAITAGSTSMNYGGTPPAVTPGYSAFAGTDSVASLTTPPTCTTTATNATPAGTDTGANTCSGAVDGNYNFTYVPGNVTVGKAALTITASGGTMTYGGTPPTVTPGYSAFAGSDTVASLTTAPTCTTTATSSTPVGTDTGANTCSGAVDSNYTITYVPGNVTVNKATPTITWATPASITSGTTLSSTQLNATASAPGTFVYNPAAGTTPAVGSDTLSVTFTPTPTDAGDYNTATATVTLAVTDFTFAPPNGSPTTATVVPGSPATYTLSVGGEGGLSGTVTFTCTGAPSEATCTASPNPATAGSSPTTVTISVTTTAPSASVPRSRPLPPVPPLRPGLPSLGMLAMAVAAMAWTIVRRKQPGMRRWQAAIVPLAVGVLLILALAGCGGGGGGGSTSPAPNPGTPAGTYTLTVTGTTGSGSSTLTHSVTLTLNVS